MLYHSTNRNISQFFEKISFREALLSGIAPDEGLWMPTKIPTLSKEEILSLKNKPYYEIAFKILRLFLENEIADEDLLSLLKDAYNFDIPILNIDKNLYLAQLDQGQTASFKDFAARFLARITRYFLTENQQITILVATSGDTGGAVGDAFKGVSGVKVYILYPENEVSQVQKQQLETIGGNVQALCIKGKFDDCQYLVKKAFTDNSLKDLHLTSANSINVGRVLPQIVYYFYMYLQIAEDFEAINYCIPSGNLGNSLGAEIARRMGLPIHQIIIATNQNKAFPEFLRSKNYQKIEPSLNCISNAMNVGNPSNLARYFDLYGGNIDKNGKVHQLPDTDLMQKNIKGFDVTDEETVQKIKEMYQNHQIIIEPHGSVGFVALDKFNAQYPEFASMKTINLQTAHPAKFPEIIEPILRIAPKPSLALEKMQNKTGKSVFLPNDYETLKKYLLTC